MNDENGGPPELLVDTYDYIVKVKGKSSKTKTATQAWIAKRYVVALLIFMGNICMQLLQGNLNIAIVDMTSPRTMEFRNDTIVEFHQKYNWTSQLKGLIISLFSYGFVVSLLGSAIVTRHGCKGATIYGLGITVSAIITIITPFVLQINFHAFLVCRVIQGILQGFSYSSVFEVWTRWVIVEERSKLLALGLSGQTVGFAVTYPLCGFLAHKWGWPATFYGTGTIVLSWSIIWFLFVGNDPASDKWISKSEKRFLTENIIITKRIQVKIPWLKILKTKAILAMAVGKFIFGFAYVGFMQCLPMYVKDITDSGIDSVGFISALPNLIAIFSVPFSGFVLDLIQNKKTFTVSQIHRMFLIGGFSSAAIVWSTVGFIQNFTFSVVVFMAFKIVFAFAHVILYSMSMYVAPALSSIVVGLTGIFLHIGILLTPIFVGYVVEHKSHAEWGVYFKICGILHFLAAINIFLFASSEKQSWANDDSTNIQDPDQFEDGHKDEKEPLRT